MPRSPFLPALLAAAVAGWSLPVLAAPDVVATIKPIHSLVAAVMQGVGTPTLLVKGAASPHTYSLKPSDAAALEQAGIIFWTGHGMEMFLETAVASLAPKAQLVELSEAPGITLLPVREGGSFEPHEHDEHDHGDEDHDHADAHEHEHEHEHVHDEGGMDMHVFLDPVNAKAMVTRIADVLAKADPDNAAAYGANADRQLQALDALTAEISAQLAPIAERPFFVFHDAFQYFEQRFGLNVAGSITVNPENMPGAARIEDIRQRLAGLGAACVFAEPQFDPRIVNVLIEGTPARAGTLDPEGAALPEGPDLYAELLRSLARGLTDCLAS